MPCPLGARVLEFVHKAVQKYHHVPFHWLIIAAYWQTGTCVISQGQLKCGDHIYVPESNWEDEAALKKWWQKPHLLASVFSACPTTRHFIHWLLLADNRGVNSETVNCNSPIWVIKPFYELKCSLLCKETVLPWRLLKWLGKKNGCMICLFFATLYPGKAHLIIFGLPESLFRCKVRLTKSCRRSCVEEPGFRELVVQAYSATEHARKAILFFTFEFSCQFCYFTKPNLRLFRRCTMSPLV